MGNPIVVEKIVTYIEEHLDEDLSLDKIVHLRKNGAVALSQKLQTQTFHTNNVSFVICVGSLGRKL